MEETMIRSAASRHYKFSLWLIAGVTMVILLAMSVILGQPVLVNALLVSVLFSLVSSVAYGAAWKGMALTSQSGLTKFYLVAPILRMLAAAAVVLVYCLVVRDRQPVIRFISIFCAYYVVLLIFDCVYFAKVEKSNKSK